MAYVKQNFVKGQILTAEHMNHIEDGIVAAADAQSLGGKAPEYYLQPWNLLDNSDFRNPVNQRGAASYSTQWTYTIDRWYLPGSTVPVTVDGGYVSFCTADQFIGKEIKDGYYTAAIKLLDGRVFSGSAYYTAGESATMLVNNGVIDCYLMGDAGSGAHPRLRFQTVSGEAISFVWAALYEGSYTADTLPPYAPKGYAAELAECQRYYWRCTNTYFAEGFGYAFSAEAVRVSIVAPQAFRIAPTMAADNGNTENYGIRAVHGTSTIYPTSVTTALKGNRIQLTLNGSWTAGTIIVLRLESVLNFSADL